MTTTTNTTSGMTREDRIAKGWPVPYLLDDPSERLRLLREVSGYLRTCRRHHHGTDLEGRFFAMEALETLLKTPGAARILSDLTANGSEIPDETER